MTTTFPVFLLILSSMTSLLFLKSKTPLALGVLLIAQTLTITISASIFSPTTWFAYILFMIFMGALLVLFIYVASLASNNMFSVPVKSAASGIFFLALMTAIMIMTTIMNHVGAIDINADLGFNSQLSKEMIFNPLTNMFNPTSFALSSFFILFLLIALIVAVKISSKERGPLRKGKSMAMKMMNLSKPPKPE